MDNNLRSTPTKNSITAFFLFLAICLISGCDKTNTLIISIAGEGTVEGYVQDELIFECKKFCNSIKAVNVTLIAKPNDGAYFIEWRGATGEACGTDPVCLLDIPLQEINQIVAVFSDPGSIAGGPVRGYKLAAAQNVDELMSRIMGPGTNDNPFSIKQVGPKRNGTFEFNQFNLSLTGHEGMVMHIGGEITTDFIVEADSNIRIAALHLDSLKGNISIWTDTGWKIHQANGQCCLDFIIDRALEVDGKVYIKVKLNKHVDPLLEFSNWGSGEDIKMSFYIPK